MARATPPDSAGSQFFIMHKEASHLDGDYAAFGKVVNGMEVVDEIAKEVFAPVKDEYLQPFSASQRQIDRRKYHGKEKNAVKDSASQAFLLHIQTAFRCQMGSIR